MRKLRAFATCAALLIGSLAAAAAATTTATAAVAATMPTVTVIPSTGLAGGDTVHVSGTGITAGADVQVIQCDIYTGEFDEDCWPRTTTTAAADGSVLADVTLVDPVYRNLENSNPKPIYCRSDICRVFLAWTDQDGSPQVASSAELNFKGAPATIHADHTTNLTRKQWVHVWGSAYGAQGHRVQILEEACHWLIQGAGCYGQMPTVSTYVGADGRYSVSYRVMRFLPDSTDCASTDILGYCELSVVVFTKGVPDDSFGVSLYGQPALRLTFRS